MATLMDVIMNDYAAANASLRDRAAGAKTAAGVRLPTPEYPNMSGEQASGLVKRDVFGGPTGLDPTLRFRETTFTNAVTGQPQPNVSYYDPLEGLVSIVSGRQSAMPFRFSTPTTAIDIAEERRRANEPVTGQPSVFSRFGQAVSDLIPQRQQSAAYPSGPSTPMGQLGSVADQRAAFEKMAGIGAASQPNYFTSMPPLGTPQQQRAAFEALAGIQPSATAQANPLAVPGANTPVVAGLDTANRPAPIAGSASVPNRPQGFFEQLFKGPQYQSNSLPVNAQPQGPMAGTGAPMPSYINWGDPNSAADFFRADALLRQQNPSFFGLLGGNNG